MVPPNNRSTTQHRSIIELLIDDRGRSVARDHDSGLVGVGDSKAAALTDLATRLDTRQNNGDPLAQKLEIEFESFR